MSFTSSSYLVGEIAFPNKTDNVTILTQAIDQYEKEILIDLLGYKLYSQMMTAYNASIAETPTELPVIWDDFINGAEFTHEFNGIEMTLKWEGLKNDAMQSLLSYFIYYKIVERTTLHLSDVGTVKLDSKAGKRISPIDNMCNAWERMRTLYGKIPVEYKKFYSGSILGSDLPGVFNDDPSAYNFLFANKDSYPDWIFKPKWNVNYFNI